jgi:FlaA1/EpsC-like NDP-sugar epimerase
VIPLFVQQLEAGKPLTLTEPLMTRFLMSLEQSVDPVYDGAIGSPCSVSTVQIGSTPHRRPPGS